MRVRVGRGLLSLGVLTLGTGAATGLAAAAGAGPFASLPGHTATAHLAAAVQPIRRPLDLAALFPSPTAAAAQEQTVYVDDPAPAPRVIFEPPPVSTAATTTTTGHPTPIGTAPTASAPTGSASAHHPVRVTPSPSARPSPCMEDSCGGGGGATPPPPSASFVPPDGGGGS